MEPAPNKDTTNLGYKEGKIIDDVYVHARKDNGNTDLQTLATLIIP